jgi:hypothetical protein
MCQPTKDVRISKITARPDTTGLTSFLERIKMPFTRSSKSECIRNEHMTTRMSSRKTQSALDVTRTKVSAVPLAARSLGFLWKRTDQIYPAPENPIDMAESSGEFSSVHDIKQRWRRQQIAIQQKNAAPEKASFWSVLTRNRRCLSSKTRNQLRS